MDRIPRVPTAHLPQRLPDDHLLVWLAQAAGSRTGFTTSQQQLLEHPKLAKFVPTLARLHAATRRIYRRRGPLGHDHAQWRVDAALVDLADLCTAQERRTLKARKATSPRRPNGRTP